MKKLNKKGFTLIEMLVVIAIIAILVAIIVPTVTSATDKAAAATNAANLRSVAAEISVAMLNEDKSFEGKEISSYNGTDNVITIGSTKITVPAPKGVKVGSTEITKTSKFVAELKDGQVVCTYGGVTVDQFAGIAGGEKSETKTEEETKTN